MSDEPRRITAVKKTYSAGPWRLVDSVTGKEIGRSIVFEHSSFGSMRVVDSSFDTKAEAIAFMGVLAAQTVAQWETEASA